MNVNTKLQIVHIAVGQGRQKEEWQLESLTNDLAERVNVLFVEVIAGVATCKID